MEKKYEITWVLAGVCAVLLMSQSTLMAAEKKVVVVPLFGSGNKIPTVTSKTGRVWMDRNLGAIRVAKSNDDYQAYGWLYQWGRLADGHEGISELHPSGYNSFSNSDDPGHGYFIMVDQLPHDWRSPQNHMLWQSKSGVNNPCPQGFRIPTAFEWVDEINTWESQDINGAYSSILKITKNPIRNTWGTHEDMKAAELWTSTAIDKKSYNVEIQDSQIRMFMYSRSTGMAVRCIDATID